MRRMLSNLPFSSIEEHRFVCDSSVANSNFLILGHASSDLNLTILKLLYISKGKLSVLYMVRQHNFLFYNAWQSACRSSSGVGVFSFWRQDSKVFWKYSQSLSCVAVIRNMRLLSKPTFLIDCLWLQPSAPFETYQCSPERPCSGPDINFYMGHYVQANREYDATKNWSTSSHQIIWECWGTESLNLAIPTTFCAQTCLCPWTFRSFSEANISWLPALPSLQDSDCAGTPRTWRTDSTLDVSLPFVKGFSVLQSVWTELSGKKWSHHTRIFVGTNPRHYSVLWTVNATNPRHFSA